MVALRMCYPRVPIILPENTNLLFTSGLNVLLYTVILAYSHCSHLTLQTTCCSYSQLCHSLTYGPLLFLP